MPGALSRRLRTPDRAGRLLVDAWVADGRPVDADIDEFLSVLAVELHALSRRRIAVIAGPRSDGLPKLIA